MLMLFVKGISGEIRPMSSKKNVMSKKQHFYITFFLICVIVIACKKNFHVDEIFTYGLANHVDGSIAMAPQTAPYLYEPAERAYEEYMAVQEGHRLDFKNVWNLQEKDVHPPFYYVLIHLISSVFAGSASKWIAASVNIVFMLLTLWMVRKILCLFVRRMPVDCDLCLLFRICCMG